MQDQITVCGADWAVERSKTMLSADLYVDLSDGSSYRWTALMDPQSPISLTWGDDVAYSPPQGSNYMQRVYEVPQPAQEEFELLRQVVEDQMAFNAAQKW